MGKAPSQPYCIYQPGLLVSQAGLGPWLIGQAALPLLFLRHTPGSLRPINATYPSFYQEIPNTSPKTFTWDFTETHFSFSSRVNCPLPVSCMYAFDSGDLPHSQVLASKICILTARLSIASSQVHVSLSFGYRAWSGLPGWGSRLV